MIAKNLKKVRKGVSEEMGGCARWSKGTSFMFLKVHTSNITVQRKLKGIPEDPERQPNLNSGHQTILCP